MCKRCWCHWSRLIFQVINCKRPSTLWHTTPFVHLEVICKIEFKEHEQLHTCTNCNQVSFPLVWLPTFYHVLWKKKLMRHKVYRLEQYTISKKQDSQRKIIRTIPTFEKVNAWMTGPKMVDDNNFVSSFPLYFVKHKYHKIVREWQSINSKNFLIYGWSKIN
jgi:hypothetical protein